MKHLNKVLQRADKSVALYSAENDYLSEQEVLALHTYFFSPGFHCIKVPSVEAGRRVLSEYMRSFNYFLDGALLSTSPVPDEYVDLYAELKAHNALPGEKGDMEEFILQLLHHEFLAIEATAELLKTPWFGMFEQLLIDYNIMKETTIVMFMY
ncbi:hypothetical protein H0X06_01905 [Candidatus Dependentiae bacterium]|nr:hypothetical protein [Candidatus Dependentiae bacterium]